MSSSILRNGLTSPSRTLMNAGSPRSILKRPASVMLSPAPLPFAATFSLHLSPQVKSPHVHFPPSPSLIATFTAHSAGSYDRSTISVSPNPLAMPAWGDRTFSPSLEGFKLAAPPKPFRTLTSIASPAITDFEDPRSPKVQPAAKQNVVRFATFATDQQASRPSKSLRTSLASYPRSPFPSAPLSPEPEKQAAQLSRANSVDGTKRNKKGLTLAARRAGAFVSISSPLNQSFASPTPESTIKRSHKPAPLDLNTPEVDRLSQDFWQSVSLEPETADEPMVTAMEYPESAVLYEANQEAELQSATAPQIMYAGQDGVPLWSPGVPRPGATLNKIRESLMSPAIQRSSFRSIARKEITAPTPNDPFAAFPSFSVALSMGVVDSAIQYPPRVAQWA